MKKLFEPTLYFRWHRFLKHNVEWYDNVSAVTCGDDRYVQVLQQWYQSTHLDLLQKGEWRNVQLVCEE
jgi:uncharacterized protein YacL (UPF0231 family)